MSVLSGCPFSGNLTVSLTDASLTFNGAFEHYETSLRHWPRLADFDWFFRLFWLTVFDQHNESQSHQGLVKLQLVSKNLPPPPPHPKKKIRNTKSLSGWKLKCTSSEELIRRWETRSKALQVPGVRTVECGVKELSFFVLTSLWAVPTIWTTIFTTTPRFARAACLECYKSQKDWNRLFSLDTASVNIAETSTNAKERQMAGDYMLNLHTYDHVSWHYCLVCCKCPDM